MEELSNGRYERLLFRRQFVLGPRHVEWLPTAWQRTQVGGRFFLQVHPDLNLVQARKHGVELTLLGYLIDPRSPNASDRAILEGLLEATGEAGSTSSLLEHTSPLGGRWALIVDDGKDTLLFNDATGLRQAFYTAADFPEGWCASQPGLLQEVLELEPDPEAQAFIDVLSSRGMKEYWWPGDSSPYKDVKHLLPNHYLDLRRRRVHRFWPRAPLAPLSLEEGASRAAALLERLVHGAGNRFALALSLTAGLDSRAVLAAAKAYREDLYCHTFLSDGLTRWSPDIRVPARLLARLEMPHHVIPCKRDMDDAFWALYRRNVSTAHKGWGKIAFGLYHHYPEERVSLKGNVSEVARRYYHHTHAPPEKMDGAMLASLVKMGGCSFAIEHFDRWLQGARGVEACGYDLLDVFYWEQRIGSWQAMSQAERDIVREEFTPFNCRDLLVILLGVDAAHRAAPYALHRRIVEHLWDEVLAEPVNPVPRVEKLRRAFRRTFKSSLGGTPLYNVPRKIYRSLKGR